jgi:hypothetical protein
MEGEKSNVLRFGHTISNHERREQNEAEFLSCNQEKEQRRGKGKKEPHRYAGEPQVLVKTTSGVAACFGF